jgi:hypothetical protein
MLDCLGGQSRRQTSGGVHTQQVAHIGCSRRQCGAERGKPPLDFVPDILVPVAGINLELLLEQLNDGPISQCRAVGMAAAVEPGAVDCSAELWEGSRRGVRLWPQALQKRAPGRLGLSQVGQRVSNDCPHWSQNLARSSLVWWQARHSTAFLPWRKRVAHYRH